MANEKRLLIDKEPIKKFIEDGLNNPDLKKAFGYDAIEILAEIEYAPRVDAVEVVRCKDCKHCRNSVYPFIDHTLRECKVWKSATREDDFCSYGERREGNENPKGA